MLLRTLFARDTGTPDSDLAFRSRGAEVSRLEGFSDAVFGFAITLLVISSRAPDTSVELLAMVHGVLPFIASFTVLFVLWRAQFDFFRRYGLEDRRTIRLTGVLLMFVLLAVYPVKFLFTFVLDVLPTVVFGGVDHLKAVMPIPNLPKVMLMYAIGFTGVSFVFSRLYQHAATQHAVIGLSELELLDTRMIARRCLGMMTAGTLLAIFCVVLLWLDVAPERRNMVWIRAYLLYFPVLMGVRLMSRRALRRLAEQRALLVAASTSSTSVAG